LKADYRTQKKDKSYAEVAKETWNIFLLDFLFATSAKPLRLLRPDVRFRIPVCLTTID
jgi:hypothetical protein